MVYTAKCSKCKSQFEFDRSILLADEPAPACPNCKSSKTTKVFTGNAGGFILKGSKWSRKQGY